MQRKVEHFADLSAQDIANTPKGITNLNLSSHNLSYKSENELAKYFRNIPPHVTALNLSSNNFYLKNGNELAQAFAGIPKTVRNINFSDNNLSRISMADLKLAFSGIRRHLNEITLSSKDIDKRNSQDLAALATILSCIPTLKVLNNTGTSFIPHPFSAQRSLLSIQQHLDAQTSSDSQTPDSALILSDQHLDAQTSSESQTPDSVLILSDQHPDTQTSFEAQTPSAALIPSDQAPSSKAQTSCAFQLKYLYALSALSVIVLTLGIISILWANSLILGGGLAALGTVAAGHGRSKTEACSPW